jgi:beta-RFAP synthase
MFGFGHTDRPQFGGVGLMVEPPTVEATIAPADEFAARGVHVKRVERFASTLVKRWDLGTLPRCKITVSAPPDHVGLGVGTQLGLAVAAGLQQFLQLPDSTIEELARSIGRGARSAVGTYGFQHGGLIVDGGKESPAELGKLVRRVQVPEDWRFVLVSCLAGGSGLAGDREAEAFSHLPSVPPAVTDQLWRIVNDEILPAIDRSDCGSFGDAVYRFGRLAGECFSSVQGGPFASAATARLVEAIRDYGVPGVGQSSWGPAIFAITDDDDAAGSLVDWLCGQPLTAECDIAIARPNNRGAQFNTRR